MGKKPAPKARTRGADRAPKAVARALVEAETETDAVVSERYGLGKTTLQKWRARVAAGEDPEVAAEIARAHALLEVAWVGKQGRALGAAWSMLEAAARKMAAIIAREQLEESDLAALEVLNGIIDKSGGTLGGIDYAQRRAGALNGNPNTAPDSDNREDRSGGQAESERGEVH